MDQPERARCDVEIGAGWRRMIRAVSFRDAADVHASGPIRPSFRHRRRRHRRQLTAIESNACDETSWPNCCRDCRRRDASDVDFHYKHIHTIRVKENKTIRNRQQKEREKSQLIMTDPDDKNNRKKIRKNGRKKVTTFWKIIHHTCRRFVELRTGSFSTTQHANLSSLSLHITCHTILRYHKELLQRKEMRRPWLYTDIPGRQKTSKHGF